MESTFAALHQEGPREPRDFVLPRDKEHYSPHEAAGLLVGQALSWDTQRILEAFTVAIKYASTRMFLGGEGQQTGHVSEPAFRSAPPSAAEQGPNTTPLSIPGGANTNGGGAIYTSERVNSQVPGTESSTPTRPEAQAVNVEAVREQFRELGEMVLKTAINRAG